MKKKEKNQTSLITIIVLILALAIILVLYFNVDKKNNEPNLENAAKEFCHQKDVASVKICNNQIIEIRSSLLGGGPKFIHRDGTKFSCPVVSLDSMSPECKAIFNAEQIGQWNCLKIC